MDRARPAQREAATELGAGHAQDVAQHPKHRRVVVDIDAMRLPVDSDGEGHDVLSCSINDTRNTDAIRPEAWTDITSFELDDEPVDVAPAPVLSAFERGHYRMLGRAEVLRGVPVLRIVAAPHMPAGPAQAKVHPRISHGQAFLTARGVGSVSHYEVE